MKRKNPAKMKTMRRVKNRFRSRGRRRGHDEEDPPPPQDVEVKLEKVASPATGDRRGAGEGATSLTSRRQVARFREQRHDEASEWRSVMADEREGAGGQIRG